MLQLLLLLLNFLRKHHSFYIILDSCINSVTDLWCSKKINTSSACFDFLELLRMLFYFHSRLIWYTKYRMVSNFATMFLWCASCQNNTTLCQTNLQKVQHVLSFAKSDWTNLKTYLDCQNQCNGCSKSIDKWCILTRPTNLKG